MRIAFLVVLAGCPAPYQRGGLAKAVALECVDVELRTERVAPAVGIVVEWRLGNRCEHAVPIDLSRVRVFALADDGARTELHAYDPRHEIALKWLPAGDAGHDEIEYLPAVDPTWLVVELAGVDGSQARARVTIRMTPVPPELLP